MTGTLRTADNLRRQLPLTPVLVGTLCATLLLAWPVVVRALAAWQDSDDLHFAFLVPPIAFGLVWWRRSELRQKAESGRWWGLAVVGAGLSVFLVSEHVWARTPQALGLGLLVWGVVVSLWGSGVGRLVAFPVGLLTYSLALEQTLLAPAAFAMQGVTAKGATVVALSLGVPVVREGLLLHVGEAAFEVAEACSGMNSLLALLALAALLIHFVRASLLGQIAVLLSVAPMVLAANTVRVTLVLVVAHVFGEDAALGYFHGLSSLVLFGLALAGLVLVSRVVETTRPGRARLWPAI